MEIKVRKMNLSDVDAVHEIDIKSITPSWPRQGFVEALQNENAVFYVAEVCLGKDSKTESAGRKDVDASVMVVGYCGVYFAADEGEITNVAVDPAWRKLGIADKLLAVVLANAKLSGCATIFLEVRESNLSAQRLYEKHGFENMGLRKNFYREPQEHAVVMCCSL